MKTFRDIYKFPLVELGYSIGRVYDSGNNFVFQFHIESKSTREKLLKCINGEINLTNPHINFRHEDGYMLDNDHNKLILIRGWGNLTGIGDHNLPVEEAANIQDTFADFIDKIRNILIENKLIKK